MAEESIHILGICGSPIKGGNVEYFLSHSLKAAESLDGVRTNMITLAGHDIQECCHCNWCVSHASPEKFCALEDESIFNPNFEYFEIISRLFSIDELMTIPFPRKYHPMKGRKLEAFSKAEELGTRKLEELSPEEQAEFLSQFTEYGNGRKFKFPKKDKK